MRSRLQSRIGEQIADGGNKTERSKDEVNQALAPLKQIGVRSLKKRSAHTSHPCAPRRSLITTIFETFTSEGENS